MRPFLRVLFLRVLFLRVLFLRVTSLLRRLTALSSLPSFLPVADSTEGLLFQPVNCYIEEEAALQVAVVLQVRLLPPPKSTPAKSLVVNKQSAKIRSLMKLR